MTPKSNPVTPFGYAAMKARYDHLLGTERPEIVEIVSWAAGNGDRSENGDYLYGRKRMREIDRELAHLSRRMKSARVIDPADQPDKSRAFFGATVTLTDEDDEERTVTLVGGRGRLEKASGSCGRRRAGCQRRTDRLVFPACARAERRRGRRPAQRAPAWGTERMGGDRHRLSAEFRIRQGLAKRCLRE